MSGYKHGEAFCHMRYLADDGSQELLVWNSRDGVTPFVISLPSGRGATHVDWHQDRYDPTHVPAVGDWIFVDLTPERARKAARRNAERFWDDPTLPARQSFGSVEDLADTLAASYLEPRGGPDLVQVTEEVRAQLLGAREQSGAARSGGGDVAAPDPIPADQGGEGDVTQIEDGPAAAERGGASRHANPAGPTLDQATRPEVRPMRSRPLRLAVTILLLVALGLGLMLLAAGSGPRGAVPHTTTTTGGGPWAG